MIVCPVCGARTSLTKANKYRKHYGGWRHVYTDQDRWRMRHKKPSINPCSASGKSPSEFLPDGFVMYGKK